MAVHHAYAATVQDGIILIDILGRLTLTAINELHAKVGDLLDRPDGPKDILVNIDKLKTPDKGTIRASLDFMRTGQFRRLAVYGKNLPPLMMLTSKVVKSVGGDDRIKIFRDEEHARDWLAQTD